jgi:carbon-monoxide dehydrogenase large subunit
MIGNATALAARELSARVRTLAARALDCTPDEITLRAGRALTVRRAGEGIGLGDLVHRAAGDGAGAAAAARDLEVTAAFEPESPAWSSGAHVVAVELDRETGATRILRYLIVHDSGVVLDVGAVQRQILGAAVQGIGGTLAERIVFDESGQPLVATLAEFAMLRAAEVPHIELVRLETPSPHNPLGLKGAGESGCIPVYAALAAAVEDAIGDHAIPVRALPLSPQRIWEMLRAASREGA